jgi:hypothetical protein
VTISEVRLALRRLAEQLKPTGMQVLDDGSHVQLAPERRFHGAVATSCSPSNTTAVQEQAEVLAIVIADGMATRQIEEVRGAVQLSIGPEGPVSLPRDS